jgi:chromatin remodeling complex protein RSC6
MAVTKKTTPVPVVAATPAAVPEPKKKVAAAAPVPVTPVVVAPTSEPEKPVAESGVDTSSLDDLASKFSALATLLKETQAAFKVLSKDYERMKKVISKTERKRANARTNPNGFAKPAKITDALCTFLGVPAGTELSRTDVTRKINQYIKEHNLNKPENKRIILPDDKLRAILGVKSNEEVSFFSLQRFLSPLFVKKA